MAVNYTTEKDLVQRTPTGQRSWTAVADIQLLGWGTCPPGGFSGIRVNPATTAASSNVGQTANVVRMNLAMDLSANERLGAAKVYRGSYRDNNRLVDYNLDGRDDLLCNDSRDGTKAIEWVNGTFTGTQWSTPNAWCGGVSQRLFTGDFNLDRRADLLCFDIVSGIRYVDYSNGGTFAGTDWQNSAGRCNGAADSLLVGDFNGDGRDDLLCHDTVTGKKTINFADANGQFTGTDWFREANWCNGATDWLYVGKFNDDAKADLRYDPGRKTVPLACIIPDLPREAARRRDSGARRVA